MKLALIFLLFLIASCDMGPRYEEAKFFLKADTIPVTLKAKLIPYTFTWDSASLTDNRIWYDFVIGSPKNGRVAYKKRDSVWVILDSAETLKMLLWQMEQQVKQYR